MAEPQRVNNSLLSRVLYHDTDDVLTHNKAQWFKKYSASVQNTKHVAGTDGFDNYVQNSIHGADGFNQVKTPDGSTLGDKLKNAGAPGVDETKRALANAFRPTNDFTDAQQAFNNEASKIADYIVTNPDNFHPGVIGSTLLELKGEGVNAIKAQQAHEKTELTNLFADDNFKRNLQASTGCTDAELGAIKNEMFAELDKTHKDQLKQFEDGLAKSAGELFKASEKEFNRVSFLGYWFNRDKKMREEMLALSQNAAQQNGPAAYLQYNGDTGDVTLKDVNVRQLQRLKTLGAGMFDILGDHDITKTGDDTYSIKLNRLFQSKESIEAELVGLTSMLKAAGYDACVLNVSHSDPKKAEELGRRAYEAAIRAGFPPEKITINVNNETKLKYDDKGKLEKDELFKDRPERLTAIKKTAKDIADSLKAHVEGSPDQVKKFRSALKAMQPAAPAQPQPPQPGGGAAPIP